MDLAARPRWPLDQRAAPMLGAALDTMPSEVRGDTGLYDTVLAAYREAQRNYNPGRENSVVVVTDGAKEVTIAYHGILPDLFREGQGIVAQGAFGPDRTFHADQVLAKHDETYMPREVADRLKATGEWRPENGSPPTPGASRL